ncbi:ditrans,polycis-polyprenyl diphosphate synthase [Pneumocystis jirovecii RU7]|uniref:ditrans,polycis-polyprenyl diphosphate synthase [(2E,6E)-farnesyldiphosphate specific] n=2 Tax=Pneumocystis jirovecii TaxID=42068 RepID=A0A0W4ZDW4_PNEJ7|nr:ditrans,polycis-polyprenyl diphosphate synthase [Pneumocystis jirovecii RU7]KTW26573.1 hypothetical protein T551_03490 [Pneumocystis jirovecii RU7]
MWSPPKSRGVIFFYKIVLIFLQIAFTIWSRLYMLCFTINEYISAITKYHHRTPQIIKRDVGRLKKIPHHLAVILEYKKDGGLELLIHQVAELSCWCVSSGIRILTIYEKEGRMKEYQSATYRIILQRMQSYFGRSRHNIKIRSPYVSVFSSDEVSNDETNYPIGKNLLCNFIVIINILDLEIIFISQEDGRESLVDLTKTLCELSQSDKFSIKDISIELVDAGMNTSLLSEPQLLMAFTPTCTLQGFPPWQIRFTEIFFVQSEDSVDYHVFMKGLQLYANAEMRWGK